MAKAKGRAAVKTARPRRQFRIEHRLCGQCKAKLTIVINGRVDIKATCHHFDLEDA